ncbi:MAG: hypothetical protein ABIK92_07970 [Pseudomonadota bacterium]
MAHSFKPINTDKLKTYSISGRKSKVSVNDFSSTWQTGDSLKVFLDTLPDILAVQDLKAVISSIAKAFLNKKTVFLGMGAHVIKVGLNPIIIDLVQKGIVNAIAMNGAGIIHDFEIALNGGTSEDVEASIGDGSFGMAQETGEFLSNAIKMAQKESLGLGEAVGKAIVENDLPFKDKSLLAAGFLSGIPVTVHVAIGTDIIHMHPGFDAGAAGSASYRDFMTFASVVSTLNEGVYLNVGSSVILPEVFLKATTLVRNLGHNLENFTTVNMDFIKQYRPMTNVVNRPTAKGGKGISLTGHHEIMLPLIAAGVIEKIASNK